MGRIGTYTFRLDGNKQIAVEAKSRRMAYNKCVQRGVFPKPLIGGGYNGSISGKPRSGNKPYRRTPAQRERRWRGGGV